MQRMFQRVHGKTLLEIREEAGAVGALQTTYQPDPQGWGREEEWAGVLVVVSPEKMSPRLKEHPQAPCHPDL